jgi:hypothetical protein
MPLPLVLKTIHEELKALFKKTVPLVWIRDEPTQEDLDHLMKQGATSEFDTSNLKKSMLDDLREGKAKLITKSCAIAKLLIVAYPDQIANIPWKAMANVFRAFGSSPSKKSWRVVWFMNPTKRMMPLTPEEEPIGPKHVNGGYTMRCDPSTVVIYREEEVLRVLVHELLHAGCTDSPNHSVEITEVKTESWAELFLIAILCIERPRLLKAAWDTQAQWIADQEEILRNEYGINSPADYAWRYTVGRRFVLEGLGVRLPSAGADPRATVGTSLRFTAACPPL